MCMGFVRLIISVDLRVGLSLMFYFYFIGIWIVLRKLNFLNIRLIYVLMKFICKFVIVCIEYFI